MIFVITDSYMMYHEVTFYFILFFFVFGFPIQHSIAGGRVYYRVNIIIIYILVYRGRLHPEELDMQHGQWLLSASPTALVSLTSEGGLTDCLFVSGGKCSQSYTIFLGQTAPHFMSAAGRTCCMWGGITSGNRNSLSSSSSFSEVGVFDSPQLFGCCCHVP